MSDTQIIDKFVQEYGAGIYLAPPNAFGWIMPYASVGLGLVVIWLFIKKYRKPTPAHRNRTDGNRRPGRPKV